MRTWVPGLGPTTMKYFRDLSVSEIAANYRGQRTGSEPAGDLSRRFPRD